MLGLGRNSLGMSLIKLVLVVDANLARAFVLIFSSLKTFVIEYPIKVSNNFLTFQGTPTFYLLLPCTQI